MRAAYSNIDYLIANSKDTKNDLIKYKIIDDKKIKIISNPISVDARKKDNFLQIKKFIKHKYIITGCGSLSDQKNFKLLIDAFFFISTKNT